MSGVSGVEAVVPLGVSRTNGSCFRENLNGEIGKLNYNTVSPFLLFYNRLLIDLEFLACEIIFMDLYNTLQKMRKQYSNSNNLKRMKYKVMIGIIGLLFLCYTACLYNLDSSK